MLLPSRWHDNAEVEMMARTRSRVRRTHGAGTKKGAIGVGRRSDRDLAHVTSA